MIVEEEEDIEYLIIIEINLRDTCTRNETFAGCDDIIPIDSRDLYTWDGVIFCVNYNDYNYEYYLNFSDSEGENYPSGYKKCGILDT